MAMTDTPLIIAGGGGGIDSAKSTHAGCDASTNTTGNPRYRSWSCYSTLQLATKLLTHYG